MQATLPSAFLMLLGARDNASSQSLSEGQAACCRAVTRQVDDAGGSTGWQAPEQLIARSGGDARQGYTTDVFSYGMLLFYCLTAGKHPFGEHYERDFNILQVNI